MRSRANPFVYAATAAGALLLYWFAGQPGGLPADRECMLGTWTDEAGPPGNSIRFYYVPTDIPGTPLVQAYEGHVTLVHFLGEEAGTAIWNYGGWDPLALNVMVGKKGYFAAVRKVDDDHILIRFGTDPEEMYRPEAIDHPDTRRLTRTGREPTVP
jgi:hypothetical protein